MLEIKTCCHGGLRCARKIVAPSCVIHYCHCFFIVFIFSPHRNDVALLLMRIIMRRDAQIYELWRSHDDDADLLAKIGLGSSVLAPRGARPP